MSALPCRCLFDSKTVSITGKGCGWPHDVGTKETLIWLELCEECMYKLCFATVSDNNLHTGMCNAIGDNLTPSIVRDGCRRRPVVVYLIPISRLDISLVAAFAWEW